MTAFVPAYRADGAPAPAPAVFVLHGLLGGVENWQGFARALAQRLPGWGIVRVDLRNHGASRPAPPPHDLRAVVEDLERLASRLDRPVPAVVGHSLGGKVALLWACRHAEARCAVVVDAAPGAGATPAQRARIEQVLDAVTAVDPARYSTRQSALAALVEATGGALPPRVAAWLTTRLERGPDGALRWRFDVEGARAMLESYRATDAWPLVERGCPDGRRPRLSFVIGGASDVWREEDVARLRAAPGPIDVEIIPGAGHWVHVDAPQAVLDAVARCLGAPPAREGR